MVKEKLAIVEFPNLNHREAFAIDFAVEVECKYVGHAGDVVEDCHDAVVCIGGIHFVLLTDAVEEQLRIGTVGMHSGFR